MTAPPPPPARDVRDLPGVVGSTMRLTWSAARWRFVRMALLQLFTAVVLGAQVLLGRAALQSVLAADRHGAGVSAALLPLAALAVVSAVASLSLPVLNVQQRVLGELVQRRTLEDVLDVTVAVDLEAFDSPAFVDALQRVRTNAPTRSLGLTFALVQMVGGLTAGAGLVVALLAVQPLLVPLLLLGALPLLAISRRDGRSEFAFALRTTPAARLRGHLQSVLLGRAEAKEIRAFGLQRPFRARYDRLYDSYLQNLFVLAGRRMRLAVLGGIVVAASTTATFVLLVALISAGRLSLAQAGAAALAVRLLSWRIDVTLGAVRQLFECAPFLRDLQEFGRLAPPRPGAGTEEAPNGFDQLSVRNLGFTYPGASIPAVVGVDLDLRRGEVVALVGANGSGKSTLATLLSGLYRPTTGAIRWDGRDVGRFTQESVRRRVTVLLQDFARYDLPVHDNIAPEGSASRTAVVAAARMAGADTFLAALPDGYDTMLSPEYENGSDLSEGQWQRVALARAFHRNAPFVVLDEPAAALDPRAEDDLFQTVRTLLDGRTVLFITHRFSTARAADRIAVMDAGRVIEYGDHDTLMAAEGTYAELFRLQAAGYAGNTL